MSNIFLFMTGFFLSQLSMRYNLVEQFFSRLFRGGNSSFIRLLLYLEVAAALVSMFIPNFITALTLLPMLSGLRSHFFKNYDPTIAKRLTTAMALVVIYGCNIGGMGSLVGSPANALMLGALEFFQVAGREKINFISWFGWSLPLASFLLLLSWAIIAVIFIPTTEKKIRIEVPQFKNTDRNPGRQKTAWLISGAWFLFWSVHSSLQLIYPLPATVLHVFGYRFIITSYDLVAVLFSLVFIMLIFAPVFKNDQGLRESLVKITDLIKKIPVRGIIFVIIVLVIGLIILSQGLERSLAGLFTRAIPEQVEPLLLYFFMAFITTMLTEFISNTPVALALFPLFHSLAVTLDLIPLIALMTVGVASTNAFMLPIATPVNALIFGEIKNVSLRTMVFAGFLLNIASAFGIAIFLSDVIPWYYGL